MPQCRCNRWRVLVSTLSALMLVAGASACGGSDDDTDGSQPDSDQRTTTSRPDDANTSTTVEAEGPAEWVDVVYDIFERSFELRANPDPSRVGDLYSETCDCWEDQQATVQFLLDNDERIEGQAAQLLFVRHEQTDPETGLVNLTVMARTGALRRVSADGELVEEIPAEEPGCVAYALLDDGPGGAYRIYSQTALPACPEEAT